MQIENKASFHLAKQLKGDQVVEKHREESIIRQLTCIDFKINKIEPCNSKGYKLDRLVLMFIDYVKIHFMFGEETVVCVVPNLPQRGIYTYKWIRFKDPKITLDCRVEWGTDVALK